MTKHVELCDVCLAVGIRRPAIAVYWNDEGDKYHACKKHLQHVKQAGLQFELLEESDEPT